MIIKLTKLKELPDAFHPNNIEEGRVEIFSIKDYLFKKPIVGERFTLMDLSHWFSTSLVQEIVDENTFKTLNSIYKWEIIDIERD